MSDVRLALEQLKLEIAAAKKEISCKEVTIKEKDSQISVYINAKVNLENKNNELFIQLQFTKEEYKKECELNKTLRDNIQALKLECTKLKDSLINGEEQRRQLVLANVMKLENISESLQKTVETYGNAECIIDTLHSLQQESISIKENLEKSDEECYIHDLLKRFEAANVGEFYKTVCNIKTHQDISKLSEKSYLDNMKSILLDEDSWLGEQTFGRKFGSKWRFSDFLGPDSEDIANITKINDLLVFTFRMLQEYEMEICRHEMNGDNYYLENMNNSSIEPCQIHRVESFSNVENTSALNTVSDGIIVSENNYPSDETDLENGVLFHEVDLNLPMLPPGSPIVKNNSSLVEMSTN